MVVMAQVRTFNLRLLFSHSLDSVLWLLVDAYRGPAKTAKFKLLHALEACVAPVEHVPDNAAHVYDAIVIIQSMNAKDLLHNYCPG